MLIKQMREIRAKAMRHRQWTAFAISLCAWLLFLFGAAAIFMVCEDPDQNWSYFDGLYMAFVALTTIGYGDLTPTTSSGRSFFVLWSLLAVPTVTIMIASAEDTLLKALRGIITFLGSISVLPGESGFPRVLKGMFTRRPGLDALSEHVRSVSTIPLGAATDRHPPTEIPSARRKFHITVLDEITHIIHDLSRQDFGGYPVDRMVWYMRLIKGHDNAENIQPDRYPKCESHSRSRVRMSGGHLCTRAAPSNQRGQPSVWHYPEFSVGSPLIGPREEVQWILGELLQTLKKDWELHDMVREEEETNNGA